MSHHPQALSAQAVAEDRMALKQHEATHQLVLEIKPIVPSISMSVAGAQTAQANAGTPSPTQA